MFMLPFQDPVKAQEREEARARRVMDRAVSWLDANQPREGHDIGILAETYKIENPMDLVFPNAPTVKTGNGEALYSPSKKLRYSKKIFPKLHGLPVTDARDLWHDFGRAYFTDDVVIPVLEQHKVGGWKPWMSLAPVEVWTMRSGVRAATKNVVIGGLGMGHLLLEVAKKRTVKNITVVEVNQELIDWFGAELVQAIGDQTHRAIDLTCQDIWEYEFEPRDRVLIDIWEGSGDARWDRRLKKLRGRKKYVWAWGSPRGSEY